MSHASIPGTKTLVVVALFVLCSCTMPIVERNREEMLLRETLLLAREVKQFERTIGIEPTEALTRGSRGARPAASMLWIWLQKLGTIATRGPIDARIGIKFSLPKEQVPLDQIYRAPGYSHYFRQGSEFGDDDSVITLDFAKQRTALKVKVIIHEDLHDARNFDLPWEDEEALITPLGMLAALQFLEQRSDAEGAGEMKRAIDEERQLSRELLGLIQEAERIFPSAPLLEGRKTVLHLLPAYPIYNRYYRYQLRDQDADLALEAKLSHDLAYYRYFDRVVSLYEKIGDLKVLIRELKETGRASDGAGLEEFLQNLESKYCEKIAN